MRGRGARGIASAFGPPPPWGARRRSPTGWEGGHPRHSIDPSRVVAVATLACLAGWLPTCAAQQGVSECARGEVGRLTCSFAVPAQACFDPDADVAHDWMCLCSNAYAGHLWIVDAAEQAPAVCAVDECEACPSRIEWTLGEMFDLPDAQASAVTDVHPPAPPASANANASTTPSPAQLSPRLSSASAGKANSTKKDKAKDAGFKISRYEYRSRSWCRDRCETLADCRAYDHDGGDICRILSNDYPDAPFPPTIPVRAGRIGVKVNVGCFQEHGCPRPFPICRDRDRYAIGSWVCESLPATPSPAAVTDAPDTLAPAPAATAAPPTPEPSTALTTPQPMTGITPLPFTVVPPTTAAPVVTPRPVSTPIPMPTGSPMPSTAAPEDRGEGSSGDGSGSGFESPEDASTPPPSPVPDGDAPYEESTTAAPTWTDAPRITGEPSPPTPHPTAFANASGNATATATHAGTDTDADPAPPDAARSGTVLPLYATRVVGIAGIVSAAAGAGLGAAPATRFLTATMRCRAAPEAEEGVLAPRDYPMGLAPVRIDFAGSAALGVLAAAVVLVAAAAVLTLCLSRVVARCRGGRGFWEGVHLHGAVGNPSAPLILLHLVYAGAVVAAGDLALAGVSSSFHGSLGAGGAVAVGAIALGVLFAAPVLTWRAMRHGVGDPAQHAQAPSHAVYREDVRTQTHPAARAVVGAGEWVSRRPGVDAGGHWVARWGAAVHPYRPGATWYFLGDFVLTFAVAAAQAVPARTPRACGHAALVTGCVFLAALAVETRVWPRALPRNTLLEPGILAGQAAAMFTLAGAHYSGAADATIPDVLVWACVVGIAAHAFGSVLGCLWVAVTARRSRLQREAFADTEWREKHIGSAVQDPLGYAEMEGGDGDADDPTSDRASSIATIATHTGDQFPILRSPCYRARKLSGQSSSAGGAHGHGARKQLLLPITASGRTGVSTGSDDGLRSKGSLYDPPSPRLAAQQAVGIDQSLCTLTDGSAGALERERGGGDTTPRMNGVNLVDPPSTPSLGGGGSAAGVAGIGSSSRGAGRPPRPSRKPAMRPSPLLPMGDSDRCLVSADASLTTTPKTAAGTGAWAGAGGAAPSPSPRNPLVSQLSEAAVGGGGAASPGIPVTVSVWNSAEPPSANGGPPSPGLGTGGAFASSPHSFASATPSNSGSPNASRIRNFSFQRPGGGGGGVVGTGDDSFPRIASLPPRRPGIGGFAAQEAKAASTPRGKREVWAC